MTSTIADVLSPTQAVRAAMQAHPAYKFAVAVLGLAGAVTLALKYGLSPATLVFGVILLVVLMVLFLVFAQASAAAKAHFALPGAVLVWSFLTLAILTATLLFTSTFFDTPLPFKRKLVQGLGLEPRPAPSPAAAQTTTSSIDLSPSITPSSTPALTSSSSEITAPMAGAGEGPTGVNGAHASSGMRLTDSAEARRSESQPAASSPGRPEAMSDSPGQLDSKTGAIIRATGTGFPPAQVAEPGRRRALARRAAEVDALRHLAEQIKGAIVHGMSRTDMAVLSEDEVKVRVAAVVKLAKVVTETVNSDGSIEILMEAPAEGPGGSQ